MRELKFTLVVTGQPGSGETQMTMHFDPAIGKEGDRQWEGSGAGIMAVEVMKTIQRIKQEARQ